MTSFSPATPSVSASFSSLSASRLSPTVPSTPTYFNTTFRSASLPNAHHSPVPQLTNLLNYGDRGSFVGQNRPRNRFASASFRSSVINAASVHSPSSSAISAPLVSSSPSSTNSSANYGTSSRGGGGGGGSASPISNALRSPFSAFVSASNVVFHSMRYPFVSSPLTAHLFSPTSSASSARRVPTVVVSKWRKGDISDDDGDGDQMVPVLERSRDESRERHESRDESSKDIIEKACRKRKAEEEFTAAMAEDKKPKKPKRMCKPHHSRE